jgi:hypothetical protein
VVTASSLGRLACEPMTVRGCAFTNRDTTANGLLLGERGSLREDDAATVVGLRCGARRP